MIRFILGMLILMGAVGQDDYAMEAGITAPPLMQTLLLALFGLGLMFWALPKLIEQSKDL